MPLEGVFVEACSRPLPDLSLNISLPANTAPAHETSAGCFDVSNWRREAHVELSLGRNAATATHESPPAPPPRNNNRYQLLLQQNQNQNPNRHRHVNRGGNDGVSAVDVSSSSSSSGLKPIKGIPVYHNRSFPFLPSTSSSSTDNNIGRGKDPNKMCFYQIPSYPPSSSYLDPMSIFHSGGPNGSSSSTAAVAYHRLAAGTRFNGDHGFKSHHQLHHNQFGVGLGPTEGSHGMMRARFIPKLPTKRSMRAPRMRWTSTLHARFVHAVELLGGHESK